MVITQANAARGMHLLYLTHDNKVKNHYKINVVGTIEKILHLD
jgi:hypothetical protein